MQILFYNIDLATPNVSFKFVVELELEVEFEKILRMRIRNLVFSS